MNYRPHSWSPAAPPRPWRALAGAALELASRALATLAERLAIVPANAPEQPPLLEFYAEAGAPEGALYIDGELVGRLDGVNRL